jgi:hypothetical protein
MTSRPLLRIPCRSNADAKELALRLQADGYSAVRRWKAVVARTATPDEAALLAGKLGVGLDPGTSARGYRRWTAGSLRWMSST